MEKFLLSTKTNPNSRVRANGVRFWGYPQRRGGLDAITCIVVHTTESPLGTPAMNVARWQAYTAPTPSSYHALADPVAPLRTLEDQAVAFHAVGMNTRGLGLSFVHQAEAWGRSAEQKPRESAMLANGAKVAAEWVERYGIPLRWLSKAQADRGTRGFIRHSTADPARRSDPGRNFPAHEFFALVVKELAPPTPEPEEEEEITMKRLIHIGRRGGTAYEVVHHPEKRGEYALKAVPNRYVAQVITGSDTWPQETVVMGSAEAKAMAIL